MIRPARSDDFDDILRLNAQWEHVTAPLSEESLARLHSQAACHYVVEIDSRVIAFLLALGPGASYDSVNYRWFDTHSEGFLYIDRVVVAREHQRSGLGEALYDLAFACAEGRGVERVVCEVDIDPHNAASDAFHARRGFVEVGTQRMNDADKHVSLRECIIRDSSGSHELGGPGGDKHGA